MNLDLNLDLNLEMYVKQIIELYKINYKQKNTKELLHEKLSHFDQLSNQKFLFWRLNPKLFVKRLLNHIKDNYRSPDLF